MLLGLLGLGLARWIAASRASVGGEVALPETGAPRAVAAFYEPRSQGLAADARAAAGSPVVPPGEPVEASSGRFEPDGLQIRILLERGR